MATPAKPYRAIKKAVKTVKAVGAGYADYVEKTKAVNKQAEKNLKSTFGNSSTANDASRVSKEMGRLKKEQNISLMGSIRSKMK